MTQMQEKVLCLPRSVIMEIHDFQGFSSLFDLQEILSSDKLEYVYRDTAEVSPWWKQLIPYCLVYSVDLEAYFVYRRGKKGSENRLHEKLSLGVGGHINPVDGEALDESTYYRGAVRELLEEIDLATNSPAIVGFLNDDSTPVGQVHFGIVHEVIIPKGESIHTYDPALEDGEFRKSGWCRDNIGLFENWSQFLIKNIM